MLGNFGQRGWDDLPDDDMGGGGGGSSNNNGKMSFEERMYKYRFKIPEPAKNPLQAGRPVVHRLLILDSAPYRVWEHGLYKLDTKHYHALCLDKNKLDDRGCPVCHPDGGKRKPSHTGFLTVIDMGQVEYLPNGKIRLHHREWKDNKGEVHVDAFPRRLLAARSGSQENPGTLKKLLWEAERLGNSLQGTVWDLERTGKKVETCGDTLRFVQPKPGVDRLTPDKYEAFLRYYGAPEDQVLELEPLDLLAVGESGHSILEPLSYEEMSAMVGWKTQSTQQRTGHTEGAGYNEPNQRGYQDRGGNEGTQGSLNMGGGDGWGGGDNRNQGLDDDDIPF